MKEAINERVIATLEECAGELESQVKRNSRVDTGKTKNSFQHKVDNASATAFIGSSNENAIWEEFGTGEFSLKGGRQGGWKYKDAQGEWHFTHGKKPSRAFWNAYTSMKQQIISRFQDVFKGL